MGEVARDTIQLYLGDIIHDGLVISEKGLYSNYLWIVRKTGTSIAIIDGMNKKRWHFLKFVSETSGHRFFLIGNVTSYAGYLQEISYEEVREMIEHYKELI
jgi:hypothetical protein